MIISRTPFRLSFFGGGTDYPAWYRRHGGTVLGVTIDKYCYITCRYLPPFFEHRFCIIYSKMEYCQTVDEINHPAVREVLKFLNIDRGLEIHHDGDLPARSGMGSSSAFTVGLLNALYALTGRMASKRQLALEGVHVEQERLKETVGSQDQVLAAHGGLNHITFLPNGEISVKPVTISAGRMRELNSHLMLFYTGIKRTASQVAQTYVHDIDSRRRQLRIMKDLVDESISILNSRQDLVGFGELLYEAWQVKRSLSADVSNTEVDELVASAMSAGAVGGKITGAGGGGFLLLFVPHERQAHVRARLSRLIHVPFRFEFGGSQILFADSEQEYPRKRQLGRSNLSAPSGNWTARHRNHWQPPARSPSLINHTRETQHLRILVTGGAGYIGSILVPLLLNDGHNVTVVDNFLYGQTSLLDCCHHRSLTILAGDVRDCRLLEDVVPKADVVLPLACLTGAPICAKDPWAAKAVNFDAVKTIADMLSPSQMMIFPSTNSGYGVGEGGIHCDEETPLRPVSLYGRLKVELESLLLDRGTIATFRFATLFGVSPRMRLDLLVNDFTYRAITDRFIVLFEAHFKRNYLHVRDAARAFLHVIANYERMKGRAYNVGLSDANLSKLELCELIKCQVPSFQIATAEVGQDPDQRNYIVSNARIEATGFKPMFDMRGGIEELIKGYKIVRRHHYANA